MAKKLKKSAVKKEHPETAYIVVYTVRIPSSRLRGTEKFKDYWEVFCERDSADRIPKIQAKNRVEELDDKYDEHTEGHELYTWNIAKITQTNEWYKTGK